MALEIKPLWYITKEVRSWRKFNHDAFEDDLSHPAIGNLTDDYRSLDLDEMVKLYDKTLSSMLDEHCPSRKLQIRNNVSSPWLDSDCRAKRRYVRVFESRYRRTKADDDRAAWCVEQRAMHKFCKMKETDDWCRRVNEEK